MTGMLRGSWEIKNFSPMGFIPTGVKLTSYSGGNGDITEEKMNEYIKLFEGWQVKNPS